jgi:hypothetical protein
MLNKSMLKINSTTNITKKCVNPDCTNPVTIKIYANTLHPEFNQPIVGYRKKLACSHDCHTIWQKSTTWEDRIGKQKADEIRNLRSKSAKIDNPSTRPGVAEKISNSMRKFLQENPGIRSGENNPFFGRVHTEEIKQIWKESKKGKWAYNNEQKIKQQNNTPKKENHPNWHGGIANGEYGPEFNKELKGYIKESYNHCCQLCSDTNVDLDIHHIDYNKKNNLFTNLVPLCKVCHGKTNYDRETWQKIFEEKLTKK